MLSKLQVLRICQAGQGSRECRYLDRENDVYNCKKLSPESKIIDEEVDSYIKEAKLNNIDPFKQNIPFGDGNGCKGYLFLPNKIQGFDVP